MRLRVLGPLEVVDGSGPRTIPAAKPRMLLAALTLRRGATLGADELIDALWGEQPPPSAAKLLQVYVSQLRKVLPGGMTIQTRPAGYALEVDPTDVDAARFETYLAEGRSALRSGNAALAAAALSRGLALWRGAAYADVRYEPFATEEAERLEALRETAVEERIEADLRLGRHAEVLGELRGLIASDATRERLAGLAMLAAYRTAGPTEALAIFGAVRDALAEELDTEPGPELMDLRRRIEERDPGLEPDAAPEHGVAASPLPLAPNALIGRRRELDELRALIERPGVRLVTLTGAGGSGKSRLALELARELEPTFANGVVLIELASLRDAALVPSTIARELGLEPGPDAIATVADALVDRELVLVLDNVEHLREAAPVFVRLLAAAPRLVIVATTRVVLHVSGEHVYPVAPLAAGDAVALFAERARALDPAFELTAQAADVVASICRHVDGLPLAIELAAARVRALGLRTLDARLATRLSVLTGGPRDLPARQQTLRETLAWSVHLLEPRHTAVLAALAVFPGGSPVDGVQAVAGADDEALIALVDHSLVQATDSAGERRFRLLETVREYAYELLADEREATEARLVTWVRGLVETTLPDSFSRVPPTAYARLDTEIDNIRDALRHATRDPDPSHELAIAATIWKYWWIRGLLAEGRAVYDGILERRGLVPTSAGIKCARAAASLAWAMSDLTAARPLAERALAGAREIGDVVEQMSAHNTLAVIARTGQDLDEAERHLRRAIELARSIENGELEHMYGGNLGAVYLDGGKYDAARAQFQAVLEYRRHEGLSEGVAYALLNLGQAEYQGGNYAEAESHFTRALAALRPLDFRARIANALQGLAAVEARTGRSEAAARRLGVAAALVGETGWGSVDSPLEAAAVEAARAALGDELFERLFAEGVASGVV